GHYRLLRRRTSGPGHPGGHHQRGGGDPGGCVRALPHADRLPHTDAPGPLRHPQGLPAPEPQRPRRGAGPAEPVRAGGAMEQTLEREQAIRRWFSMWLTGADTGISTLFARDCVYIESWGPAYQGSAAVARWFEEWNRRGQVLRWEIRQFFHR